MVGGWGWFNIQYTNVFLPVYEIPLNHDRLIFIMEISISGNIAFILTRYLEIPDTFFQLICHVGVLGHRACPLKLFNIDDIMSAIICQLMYGDLSKMSCIWQTMFSNAKVLITKDNSSMLRKGQAKSESVKTFDFLAVTLYDHLTWKSYTTSDHKII